MAECFHFSYKRILSLFWRYYSFSATSLRRIYIEMKYLKIFKDPLIQVLNL